METGSTSDATTEQGPREKNPEERDQRSRHTKTAINSGLGLSDDDEYQSLYCMIEQWLTGRNLVNKTHRLMGERTRLQEQLSAHLMPSQKARKDFPKLVDALRSTAGQEALQELIYKVCSNYRRRLRRKQRDAPDDAVEVPTRCAGSRRYRDNVLACADSRNSESIGHVHTDSRSSESIDGAKPRRGLGSNLVCLVRSDGTTRVICSVCELAPSWPAIRSGNGGPLALVKGLSLELLLCKLGKNTVHQLGWIDHNPQRVADTQIVETDRQLGTVVYPSLKDCSIDFKIIGDVEDGES